MMRVFYTIEDERILLDPDTDSETTLEMLGGKPHATDLEGWQGMNAQVVKHENGKRTIIGSVDELLEEGDQA